MAASIENPLVTAIQPPTGAMPSTRPRIQWLAHVNRFVYEYSVTATIAIGASASAGISGVESGVDEAVCRHSASPSADHSQRGPNGNRPSWPSARCECHAEVSERECKDRVFKLDRVEVGRGSVEGKSKTHGVSLYSVLRPAFIDTLNYLRFHFDFRWPFTWEPFFGPFAGGVYSQLSSKVRFGGCKFQCIHRTTGVL